MKKKVMFFLICLCISAFGFCNKEPQDKPNSNTEMIKKNIDYPNWIIAISSIISSISTILIIIQIRKTSKDEIEDRLFRLIDLHKKNVDDLLILDKNNIYKSGHEIIMKLCNEVHYIIRLIDKNPTLTKEFNDKDKKVFAYLYICHGLELVNNSWFETNYLFKKYAKKDLVNFVADSIKNHNDNPESKNKFLVSNNGFINVISRYFRHLFQIIKFIDDQKFISKKTKYQYIKILRSSLTNREQEFIFDNCITPYGNAWIEKKYFTKYKIIKNIAFYYIEGYDPIKWFIEELKISPKKVSQYFEHYEYKES